MLKHWLGFAVLISLAAAAWAVWIGVPAWRNYAAMWFVLLLALFCFRGFMRQLGRWFGQGARQSAK